MFYAAVETDVGEILNIICPDGRIGGDAILSFLLGLSGYCANSDDPETGWFNALESRSTVQICRSLAPLLNSFYSGEWNYEDDDYDIFRRQQPEPTLTEGQFIETVHQVREKWTDIASLVSAVKALLSLISTIELPASSWYNGQNTVVDFDGLLQALKLAQERKAQRVRIRFK